MRLRQGGYKPAARHLIDKLRRPNIDCQVVGAENILLNAACFDEGQCIDGHAQIPFPGTRPASTINHLSGKPVKSLQQFPLIFQNYQ